MRRVEEAILAAAGWQLARIGRHRVWRCPCGAHTEAVSKKTANALAETYARKAVRKCRNRTHVTTAL